MKHIKRKFLLTKNVEKDGYDYLVNEAKKPQTKVKISSDKWTPHVLTDKMEFIQAFFFNLNGSKVVIPEPNPIVIYFSNAQGFLSAINNERDKLFLELKKSDYNIGEILNHMFGFYGCVVNFSSSLFDSIEAFVNSKIPKDFTYPNPIRRKKIMDKYKIIRYMSLDDKTKLILPEIYKGENFATQNGHLYDSIKKLKKLRDNITHAKSDFDYDVNYYEKLFTQALNFDYHNAINAARDFINFYEKNLIEPCDCGLEH